MIFQSYISTVFEGNYSSMNILPYSLKHLITKCAVHPTYCIAEVLLTPPLLARETPYMSLPQLAPLGMEVDGRGGEEKYCNTQSKSMPESFIAKAFTSCNIRVVEVPPKQYWAANLLGQVCWRRLRRFCPIFPLHIGK